MWFLKPYPAAALLLIGSVTALAQSPTPSNAMSAYFGNTLACRTAAMQCHIWFNHDGTYRQFETVPAADGSFRLTGFDGEFKLMSKDGVSQTCLTPKTRGGPGGRRPLECYPLSGHKSGDEWDAKTNDGTVIHFSLQSGHHVNAGSDLL